MFYFNVYFRSFIGKIVYKRAVLEYIICSCKSINNNEIVSTNQP